MPSSYKIISHAEKHILQINWLQIHRKWYFRMRWDETTICSSDDFYLSFCKRERMNGNNNKIRGKLMKNNSRPRNSAIYIDCILRTVEYVFLINISQVNCGFWISGERWKENFFDKVIELPKLYNAAEERYSSSYDKSNFFPFAITPKFDIKPY